MLPAKVEHIIDDLGSVFWRDNLEEWKKKYAPLTKDNPSRRSVLNRISKNSAIMKAFRKKTKSALYNRNVVIARLSQNI